MKPHILLVLLSIGVITSSAQTHLQIVNDSVKIVNAEFVLGNNTQNVNGFLYNAGNGATFFKRALIKVDDSTYIVGGDTLHLNTRGFAKIDDTTYVIGSDTLHVNPRHFTRLNDTAYAFGTDTIYLKPTPRLTKLDDTTYLFGSDTLKLYPRHFVRLNDTAYAFGTDTLNVKSAGFTKLDDSSYLFGSDTLKLYPRHFVRLNDTAYAFGTDTLNLKSPGFTKLDDTSYVFGSDTLKLYPRHFVRLNDTAYAFGTDTLNLKSPGFTKLDDTSYLFGSDTLKLYPRHFVRLNDTAYAFGTDTLNLKPTPRLSQVDDSTYVFGVDTMRLKSPAVASVNDTTYLIGNDTLKLNPRHFVKLSDTAYTFGKDTLKLNTLRFAKQDDTTYVFGKDTMKLKSYNNNIVYLPDIPSLRSYSGTAVTILVQDSLRGGTFHYMQGTNADDSGTVFTAIGKGSGFWKRSFNPSFGINVLWFGAKGNYNYFTHTGNNDYSAIQQAINIANLGSYSVYIPRRVWPSVFASSAPLQLGQSTKIYGDKAMMPVQYIISAPDDMSQTLKFNVQSGIYFYNGTNGLETQSTNNYRTQAPDIRDLAILGTGRKNNTATGINFKSNPNYVTSSVNAQDVGLANMRDVYVNDFYIGVDAGRTDTWWIEGCAINNTHIAIKGGKQDGRVTKSDIYNADTGIVVHGAGNTFTNNEMETGGVGFVLDSSFNSIIQGNVIKDSKIGVIVRNKSQYNKIVDNEFYNLTGVGIKIDSAGTFNEIAGNIFPYFPVTPVVARQTSKIFIHDNSFYGPISGVYCAELDSCTKVTYINNSDDDYDNTHKLLVTSPSGTSAFTDKSDYAGNRQWSSGSSSGGFYAFRTSGGSYQSPAALSANAIIGQVKGEAYNGASFPQTISLNMRTSELQKTTAQGSAFDFYVTPAGTTTLTNNLSLDGTGLTLKGLDTIRVASGTAGSVDRLDYFAGRVNKGIQFALWPNGTNTLSKIGTSNNSSIVNWSGGFFATDNDTVRLAYQNLGSPSTVAQSLVLGGGTNAGGANSWTNIFFRSANGISVNGPNNPSSILTLNSTTQGFLPPVMSRVQASAIVSPADGLIMYDNALHKLLYNKNGIITPLLDSASIASTTFSAATGYTWTAQQNFTGNGILFSGTDTILTKSGVAGSVDRLDYFAGRTNKGIQFQLLPNGTNTLAKVAMANSSSNTNFSSLYLAADNDTARIAKQDVGTPSVSVKTLVIGGGGPAGGANFTNIIARSPVSVQHLIGNSSVPTVVANSGAGVSPTVSITGTDIAGTISLTTGSAPQPSTAIVTITFANSYGTAPTPISAAPANDYAAALSGTSNPYYTTTTTTLVLNAGQTALQPNTLYKWYYHVIQ